MSVGVADVGADFPAMVLRLGEKLSSLGRPFLIGLGNIGDPNIEKRAGAVRVGWSGQSHGRLVIGGASAGVEDQPRVGELQDDRIALQHDLGTKHGLVEVTGSLLVRHHQKLRHHKAVLWRWEVIWIHLWSCISNGGWRRRRRAYLDGQSM